MNKKTYLLNTLLAAVLGIYLVAAIVVLTFFRVVILP